MIEKKPSAGEVIMKAYGESNGEYIDLVVEHMNDPGIYKMWHPQDHISHRAESVIDKDGKVTTILCAEERIGDYGVHTMRLRLEDHHTCPVPRKYEPMATATSLGPNGEVGGGVYHECRPTPFGMLMRSTFRLPAKTPKEFLDALYKHAKEEMEYFPKFLPDLNAKATGK